MHLLLVFLSVSSYKPTVVVEVFSNEDVDGLTKANNILGVIKQAVEDRIIKQQSIQVASSASYVVKNKLFRRQIILELLYI